VGGFLSFYFFISLRGNICFFRLNSCPKIRVWPFPGLTREIVWTVSQAAKSRCIFFNISGGHSWSVTGESLLLADGLFLFGKYSDCYVEGKKDEPDVCDFRGCVPFCVFD